MKLIISIAATVGGICLWYGIKEPFVLIWYRSSIIVVSGYIKAHLDDLLRILCVGYCLSNFSMPSSHGLLSSKIELGLSGRLTHSIIPCLLAMIFADLDHRLWYVGTFFLTWFTLYVPNVFVHHWSLPEYFLKPIFLSIALHHILFIHGFDGIAHFLLILIVLMMILERFLKQFECILKLLLVFQVIIS